MFIPLYDGIPLLHMRHAWTTWGLFTACALSFGAQTLGLLPLDDAHIYLGFGVVPAQMFGEGVLPDGLPLVPSPLTLVTSLFIHASIWHLAGNMLFLVVFGDNVEDALGHWQFLFFFLLCGATAGLAHALADQASDRPLIGASGAVAGIVAAYVLLHPRVRVWGLFLNRIPLRLPAFWAIGAWISLQVVEAVFKLDGDVGWYAHVGGLACGAFLIVAFHRPDQALFGRDDDPHWTGDA